MPMQSWTSILISQQSDGTAVANTTTETTLLSTQAKIILPANFLVYGGQTLRIRAMGRISTLNPTPGTLTFKVKFNATPIAVASSGAIPINTTVAKTNVTWILDWDLTTRTVGGGTSAAFMNSGQWQSEAVIGSSAASAAGQGSMMFPTSAPAVGTGFDSTVANLIDLTAQWSVANAANSIQCHTYKLESLN